MRTLVRALSVTVAAGALALAAGAQETPVGSKPQLGVFADTMKTIIPGLNVADLPPEAQAAIAGLGSQRMLRVHLWTQGAPSQAGPTAALDIAQGLKLGPTLNLELPQRAPGKDEPIRIPPGAENFEMRRYWGCSATVRPGQPKVIKSAGTTPGGTVTVPRSGAGGVPEWTDAFWPNSKQQTSPVAPQGAALPGKYALRSNYVNGVNFEVPEGLNFLEPVALTTPPGVGADLSKALPLSWKPVAGAQGYHLMATGLKGKNTLILWSSAEREDDSSFAAYAPTEEIKSLVAKGVYLAPDKAQCTIPAGIFQGCQSVSIQAYAFGPSFTQNNTSPSVRVQTRSITMLALTPGAGDDDN